MEMGLYRNAQSYISVVMPIYNAESFLTKAIESIITQSYTNLELIIIDDGSTDNSSTIIRENASKDSRIHPIFISHSGIARAMNTAVAVAQGDYIAYLDHDDIALPNRLSTQLAWMQKNDIDICGSCVKRIGDRSNLMWFPETDRAICYDLLFRCSLLQTAVMLRADIARHNPYNENVEFLDYELWARLATHYRMGNVPQILTLYRRHLNQTSLVKKREFNEDFRRCREPLFYKLLPNRTPAEYAALACLIDKKEMNSLQELKLAGTLLIELTNSGDSFLNNKISQRWWSACYQSAPLGFDCYRIYREISSLMGIPEKTVCPDYYAKIN
jgi:glycosyltransferase involved in cell wall biosynthesis